MPTFTRNSWKKKWAIILYLVIVSTALFYGSVVLLGLFGTQNVEIDFSKIKKDTELNQVFARFTELQPGASELAYLSALEVQNTRRPILCQLGFNPFIAYYQLMLNPNSVVYSFHQAHDEEEELLLYKMATVLPHVVPIIGNPMHTIRAFVREFGIRGAGINQKSSLWDEYSEFSYSGDARYTIRDLYINEETGVTCDIVYRSGGTASEMSMMALLARQNTQVIYKEDIDGESLTWQNSIRVKEGSCDASDRIYCGYFKHAYVGSSNVNLEEVTGIGLKLREHRESLKKALAVADSSKVVIWIPVGIAHRFFADALYCSLQKFNVSNYVFFAHDAEMHQYLLEKGRNSFYDNLWYTTMHGKHGYHSFYFNTVMRERFSIILEVLELGYNVLMNDADTIWLENLFPSLVADEADMVAQMDQPTEKYFEVCTGFAFYKNKHEVITLVHKFQQMSFYFPRLEDQELSNLVFKSKHACLIWFNKNLSSCKPGRSISVQLKNPFSYVSGHLYCLRHDEWAAKHMPPALLHLNGAPNKDACAKQSKEWGHPFITNCK